MKMFAIAMIMEYNASSTRSVCQKGTVGLWSVVDRGDEFADVVDDMVGDAGGDECGIDHGNT